MTILECLNTLPDNMMMIDLVEIDRDKKHKTVNELKQGSHINESSYDVIEYKVNRGRTTKKQIGFRKNNGELLVIYREL